MRFLFGFTIEGRRQEGDVKSEAVRLRSFTVTDASGRERAEREAAREWAVRNMRRAPV